MENILVSHLEKKLKSTKIEGFIINKGQERVFEYFKNKKVPVNSSKVYSVTKSIVSLLIGILMDQRLIKSIHQPISDYFADMDMEKKEITILHLLTMTSGQKVVNFQGSRNWVNAILEQDLIHEPGEVFEYNSGSSHLLSAIITKVTGVSAAEFAEKSLFGPLGINKFTWVSDPQRISGGGFSISLSVEDMMKIGKLLIQEGSYQSKEIVSTEWIKQAVTPFKDVETSEFGTYGYGYQFWTFTSNGTGSGLDYYCAAGLFGQYIFVVPKLNMIAVAKAQLQADNQTLPKVYFEEFLRGLT
ncbi:serine hydrolase [Cytobacillus suaedae]|nr:serine hydrolase [Cytobacillus suaedae]